MTVDEQPVKDDIDGVGSDDYRHRHLGVAHPFEELLKGCKHHEWDDRNGHIAEVRHGLPDNLGRLSHVPHEGTHGHGQQKDADAHAAVEEDGVLKIGGRLAMVTHGVHLSDQWRQSERHPRPEDEKHEKHRVGKRHARKRHGTEPAYHGVVHKLYEYLSRLRKYDGKGKSQYPPVIS